ncbi:glycosyl transferase [Thalassospira xiamenensis]|uniref:glycosyltransferase family 9 protein n=1 Tax=Thalassospira xiamenensis TaxID=220697 RepID=UPI000DED8EA6|nr:glycosyltransferase family 9 protein [Thalassospira xiamenensis]RCK32146.1 glycosyl transferase [Thalassospira xiamenensis]
MRLLFITSNRLGDAVLSTSVLRHYVETYPGIRVTVACGPVAAPIFEAVPGLERLIEMPKQKRGGHWWKLWKSVAFRWWDIIVDLRGSATAYVLPGWKRVVLKGNDDSIHRVEQLARLIGVDPAPEPFVWIGPEHERRAAKILPTDERPLLVVGPSANWIGKTWRPECFAETIASLRAVGGVLEDAHVLLVGAPNEREASEPVIASIPENRRTEIFGSEHLLTVMACLRRADLYVGNDSGLMHMAAASGRPTLGLFGPSRDQLYRPYSIWGRVVRTDLTYDEVVPDPSYLSVKESLMDTLPVEKVVKSAEQLMLAYRSR